MTFKSYTGHVKIIEATIVDKHQHMHFFTFNSILVWIVNFNIKIHKILKGKPTSFNLNPLAPDIPFKF